MDNLCNLSYVKEENKRCRKYSAVKLPENINQNMLPKYVVYYRECYNTEKKLFREFFKIEKHPKLNKNKVYTSSKSNKISILEKLEQIKKLLYDIENIENIENPENPENLENLENPENIENPENLENPENIENPENKKKIILPKYISLKLHPQDAKKYYLIFDYKINTGERYTLKSIFSYTSENDKFENISQNLIKFKKKVYDKFENLNINFK